MNIGKESTSEKLKRQKILIWTRIYFEMKHTELIKLKKEFPSSKFWSNGIIEADQKDNYQIKVKVNEIVRILDNYPKTRIVFKKLARLEKSNVSSKKS